MTGAQGEAAVEQAEVGSYDKNAHEAEQYLPDGRRP